MIKGRPASEGGKRIGKVLVRADRRIIALSAGLASTVVSRCFYYSLSISTVS